MLPVVVIAGVFGLLVGSFLNVVISRLPAGESIVFPGSRCPSCKVPIHWYDNLPVVSFLLLGGTCRACGLKISPRYAAVEVATAVAFAAQALLSGSDPILLTQRLVFTALLVALFGTDLETQRLPNALTYPGIVIGIAFSTRVPPGLMASVIGAALGAAILVAVRWVWFRLKGVDAMGLGDVKMLAMIGAFLGWEQVWLVLFLASVAGALIGVGLIVLQRRSMESELTFGTYLALAAFASSLIGDRLLDWYLGFYT